MAANGSALGISALALLMERPMHPYEMYQLLIQRHEDRVVKVRPGSLYHKVHWLESRGLVRSTTTEREGNRPERTIYEITAEGRETLALRVAEMLATPVNEYPEFPLAIGEAHNLPKDTVVELLGRRLALLEADLEEIEDGIRETEAKQVNPAFVLNVGYSHAIQSAEVQWLRQLLADLHANVIPWPHNDQAPQLVSKE
ncbi:PadR family transcriptional regulator [Parafrigoribacterium humi]|uniref:PadR family transcriptional regulator n=1 Tax=Parafrigoribacterium humi TaxID=3144664 RepID=UPI0032EF344C